MYTNKTTENKNFTGGCEWVSATLKHSAKVNMMAIVVIVFIFSTCMGYTLCDIINKVVEMNTTHTYEFDEREFYNRYSYSKVGEIMAELVASETEEITTDSAIKDVEPSLESQLGNDIITLNGAKLINHDLPNEYYGDIDFSSFQPYMSYRKITDTTAPAYAVVNDEDAYTDNLGLRRMETTADQFTINGEDDYLVAMGTFYKDKGVVGNRYLIVTTTGMYTATTGDEKADEHTDRMNMFTRHGDSVAIIEWIVDTKNLDPTIKNRGTVTANGPEAVQGEILYVYEIQ